MASCCCLGTANIKQITETVYYSYLMLTQQPKHVRTEKRNHSFEVDLLNEFDPGHKTSLNDLFTDSHGPLMTLLWCFCILYELLLLHVNAYNI